MTVGEVEPLLARSSGGRVDPARMRRLLAQLGVPAEPFPLIHVGGTNGKGSVVALLEAVFSAAGLRVGAYTSQDFSDPLARVRVGMDFVTGERLRDLFQRAISSGGEASSERRYPTREEALAAAAFLHFTQEEVALALVEAHRDPRYEPACQLDSPLLTLVTSVEEDTRLPWGLGQAAWEQAGLARTGVPFLTTERKPQVLATFAQKCREEGAALVLVDPGDVAPVELTWRRAVWRSRSDPLGLREFETKFLGAYQGANLALTLGALAELVGGLSLSRDAIREGFASAQCPGRFEVVSQRPYVVLDGVQNPAGARALVESLERLPQPRGRQILVFGVRRDKLVRDTVEALFPRFERVVLATPSCEGALPAEALVPQAARLGIPWELGGGLGEAVQMEVRGLGDEDLLVVCGPLPALEEARGVVRQAA
ncbi:hypothetical protein DRJ54_04700 [Candidatus Acetothermia bacterium]|nr:MAG: hypothetical protein DRJ54_04700 [Candidatus Acetothermia bacterium]